MAIPEDIFLAEIKNGYIDGFDPLFRAVGGIEIAMLDWRGYSPSSVITIGSQLLHIAGFDNLIRRAMEGGDVVEYTSRSEWRQQFEAGFTRELSVEPPSGKPLEHYLQLIENESAQTLATLDKLGTDIDPSMMVNFMIDGKEFEFGEIEQVSIARLALDASYHVRYHRGQITHIKYDYLVSNLI